MDFVVIIILVLIIVLLMEISVSSKDENRLEVRVGIDRSSIEPNKYWAQLAQRWENLQGPRGCSDY